MLDAVRELDYKPRVLLIGSGEEYGHIRQEECPIIEDTVLRPGNIYAATKSCQNMLGSIYAAAYHMDVMMVRAFNHIGPNQTPLFVVADFCKQVAEIEKGIKDPVMYVGNLSAKRDFTDVRDVVRAYALLVQKGKAGETYNIGTGHALAIQEILDRIISLSDKEIEVRVDAENCVRLMCRLLNRIFQRYMTAPAGNHRFRWSRPYGKHWITGECRIYVRSKSF